MIYKLYTSVRWSVQLVTEMVEVPVDPASRSARLAPDFSNMVRKNLEEVEAERIAERAATEKAKAEAGKKRNRADGNADGDGDSDGSTIRPSKRMRTDEHPQSFVTATTMVPEYRTLLDSFRWYLRAVAEAASDESVAITVAVAAAGAENADETSVAEELSVGETSVAEDSAVTLEGSIFVNGLRRSGRIGRRVGLKLPLLGCVFLNGGLRRSARIAARRLV